MTPLILVIYNMIPRLTGIGRRLNERLVNMYLVDCLKMPLDDQLAGLTPVQPLVAIAVTKGALSTKR